MRNSFFYITTLFSLILITSCNEESITITSEYVINPNWTDNDNSFGVYKLKLINDNDSIDLKNATQSVLLSKLKKDNHIYYHGNIKYNGIPYSKRKVYFKETLGKLEQNSWYLLSGLSNWGLQHYIYIDSLNEVHKFTVNQSNW